MNDATNNFVEKLKSNDNVLGVILFGSWARGNNRPDSDVDLIVILKGGYEREVEYSEGQAFEIVYVTAEGAMKHWLQNMNDAAGLWGVARILYDKERVVEKLQNEIREAINKGKNKLSDAQVGQMKFSAEDTLKAASNNENAATANLLLQRTILTLTEQFFDIRQQWTPAPKQRLDVIKEMDGALHTLLADFYVIDTSFEEKLSLANRIIDKVFIYKSSNIVE